MTMTPQSGHPLALTPERLTLVRLSDLLDTYPPHALAALLESFRCARNHDVEAFLHATASRFERAGKSRTYLVVTTSSLEDVSASLDVVGYFTLALTHLQLGAELSNARRKKLHGLFLPGSDVVVGYLIGQLGKNDRYRDRLHGALLVEFAVKLIREAQQQVGGRFVIVECTPEEKLLAFYRDCGFVFLQTDPDDGMAQLAYFL